MSKKIFMAVLASFFLLSCKKINLDVKNSLLLNGSPVKISRKIRNINLISCSMDGGTMDDVLSLLPNDVSICMSEELRFSRVCLDVVNLDVESFLFAVSQSVGCEVSRFGSLFVFSKSKTDVTMKSVNSFESTGSYIFYFKVPYYTKEEVQKVLSASISFVSGDSYIYRGSLGEVVKMRELIDNMLYSLPCEYAFEVFFVSREKLMNMSLNGDLSASLSSVLERGAGGLSSNEWRLVVNLLSEMRLKNSDSSSCRHMCGVFREGSEFESNIGDSVPYIKRVVTENGSSYDSDVQYIEVGTRLKLSCAGEAVGVVDFSLDVNETTGYVNDYPQKRGSTIRTKFNVGGDERRFVGSFYVKSRSRGLLGVESRDSEWLVFCRVLRVSVGQSVGFSS